MIFFKFIWSNKPAKINREVVTLDKNSGGLNLIHLKYFITASKVTWIRRLILSEHKPLWITLFEKIFQTDANKFILYGSQYQAYLKRNTKNKFWLNTFDAWIEFQHKQTFHTETDVVTSPLWYNKNISLTPMYLTQLLDKGITTVSDVIDSDGAVLKMDQLKQIYSIHHLNPLHYLRVQQTIKSLFKKTKLCTFSSVERPFVPFHIKKIFINKKGTSVFLIK